MTRRCILQAVPAALSFSKYAFARQEEQRRVSPHETVSLDLGGKTIMISYGRPFLKGRTVGKEVAPFGEVWRLGADEATKITSNANLIFAGGPELSPGSYSLFAIPGPQKWTVIVNKVADQWGAFSYDQSKDVGRFDLPVSRVGTPVEQFTIALDKRGQNAAKLTMSWGNESVSAMIKMT